MHELGVVTGKAAAAMMEATEKAKADHKANMKGVGKAAAKQAQTVLVERKKDEACAIMAARQDEMLEVKSPPWAIPTPSSYRLQ